MPPTAEVLDTMTELLASGIQAAMKRDARLADEPLGPAEPQTPADYRAHCTVDAGDTLRDEREGRTGDVLGRVPAHDDVFEEWVHIDWGDFRSVEPAESIGQELFRGELT